MAAAFVLPAFLVVAVVALFPLVWTIWESLHLHDLRMPWRGRPWVGLSNYSETLADRRFWDALAHTVFFVATTVTCELVLGLAFALVMHHVSRGRGLVRTTVLLPWSLPTVVAAMVWRFLFESEAGIASLALSPWVEPGFAWLGHERAAWIPIILADVWKTTPFVALLLLAGLQNIDPSIYDAARLDRASAWRQFLHLTLPLLKPVILVALIFRTLDAFRVFDLVYVLTGGGPGTATESIAVYTFSALLQRLRFGYASALSVIIFVVTFGLAVLYIRLLGRNLLERNR